MTTTALIMAQGGQQRIGHLLAGPKQLIPIFGDQTIFERTVQQIRAAGVKRIVAVVHGGPWWVQVLDKVGVESYVQPDPGPSVVGGIFQCEHLFGDKNLIFLGDVVYSTVPCGRSSGRTGHARGSLYTDVAGRTGLRRRSILKFLGARSPAARILSGD